MAAFPTTVATDSDLYIAVNATSTQLTDNPLSNSATTVNVVSATAFPTVGFISIDNEIIKYTGKTGTSFTGCTRGADGTSATSHVQNSQVFHNVIAAHHNVLKDDLIATEQFISDLIGRTSTQVKGPDGTVSLPGYSFAADLDTGMWRAGANNLRFTVNGNSALDITTSNITSLLAHLHTDGTVSLPGIAFTNDTDTGFYRAASNEIDFTCGGSAKLTLTTANLIPAVTVIPSTDLGFDIGSTTNRWAHSYLGDGTVTVPAYSFGADTDTGMWRGGSNDIRFTTGGNTRLRVTDTFVETGAAAHYFPNGSAASPAMTFSGDTDTGFFSLAGNEMSLSNAGTRHYAFGVGALTLLSSSVIQNTDGTAGTPAFSFDNDQNTGMYSFAADDIGWTTGGTQRMHLTTSQLRVAVSIRPQADNTYGLGATGERWTDVWAANGTIQTSHSSTKSNIVEVDPDSLELPKAVYYDRDGRRWLGYLNDSLPAEGRPVSDNKANYEQAVIAVLLAKVSKLEKAVKDLSHN